VATFDIPGAFLQADMDETVHMRFEGKMAELMRHVDPKLYRKFILNEHKKAVLYVYWKYIPYVHSNLGFYLFRLSIRDIYI
jgi:hypothetical protein